MERMRPFLIPVAIVLAGTILALALYAFRVSTQPPREGDVSLVRPVLPTEHIIGNPDAPVVIVEYSDIDCEYCKQFQETMTQIMSEYADGGEVAWVYRHFPIVSAHAFAAEHAEASECAAQVGGPLYFFHFIDALAQAAPGASQFDPDGYTTLITNLGLSQSDFTTCMQSDTFLPSITADFENALAAGGKGAPYTVVLIRGAESIPITGALPYESMKEVIERARSLVK